MKSTIRQSALLILAGIVAYLGLAAAATYSNTKTISTSGTPVALLSTSTCAISYNVQAQTSNAGTVYVGASNVSAANKIGTALTAGSAVAWLPQGSNCTYDLSTIYADSTSSGDKVSFNYTR